MTSAPPVLGSALSLVDVDGWLQADDASPGDLRGQVAIVQFRTFGCSSCKAVLPEMQQIYAEYQSAGLGIVGVHSPEFLCEETLRQLRWRLKIPTGPVPTSSIPTV